MKKFIHNSALVSFLYDLMKDHLPPGTVEKLVQEANTDNQQVEFTNGYLAEYAADLSDRLLNAGALKADFDKKHSLHEWFVMLSYQSDVPTKGWISASVRANEELIAIQNVKEKFKTIMNLDFNMDIKFEDTFLPTVKLQTTEEVADKIRQIPEVKSVIKLNGNSI